MTIDDVLADQVEAHRGHLPAVAYWMLGSSDEADDAIQEGWLRLSRSESIDIENLGGWLTTVVARVCLDMLRSRAGRREDTLDSREPDPVSVSQDAGAPEREAMLVDSVGVALLVVLDWLAPAERIAFVLHHMCAVPFDQIGRIMGGTRTTARQLASRARRRVQAPAPPSRASARSSATSSKRSRRPLATATSRRWLSCCQVRGVAAVAQMFSGRACAANLALLDGFPGP